jgi:chromosome segregation ATPase
MTLSQRMLEIDRLGKDIGQLQQNILNLTKENQALNVEYLSTQENLRLSTSQTAKLAAELTELRNKVIDYEARLKRADEDLDRQKRENANHQLRFQEIEKQTRIMGDLQRQVIALAKENEMLTQDNQRAQESLRLSTSETGKLRQRINEFEQRTEQLSRENEVLKAERQKVLHEMHGMHDKLGETDRSYADKIHRMSQENKMLSDDVREGQEKLRISTSQTSKLMNEFNEIKARIDQLTRENEVLKAERQKVLQEMHGMHGKLGENDRSYGEKINKLSSENKMLSDDVREGQEKLRISTSQTSKLMNEFNEIKARIDQLTREN